MNDSSDKRDSKKDSKKEKKESKKDKIKTKKTSKSFQKENAGGILLTLPNSEFPLETELPKINNSAKVELLPTDMSETTDSESESKMEWVVELVWIWTKLIFRFYHSRPFINDAECTSMHEGRQLVHTIVPISIDTMFSLLFSKSKFFTDFHNIRKTTDLVQGEWIENPERLKERVLSMTIAITQTVGPKSSHVSKLIENWILKQITYQRFCPLSGDWNPGDANLQHTGPIIFDRCDFCECRDSICW